MMDLSSLTVPFGDPANVALRWVVALTIVALGWVVIGFLVLPAYHGIRMLVGSTIEHITSGVRWLFSNAQAQIERITRAFNAIALQDNLKSLLVDQLAQLRQTARAAAKSVNAALYRFRTAGGGSANNITARLNHELDRLAAVQTVGAPHEEAYRRRGMTLMRALLFSLLAVALMFVNTAILYEFFRPMIRFQTQVLGVTISYAFVISLLYTVAEFSMGLALEVFSEKEDRQSEGLNVAAALMTVLIATAVIVEIFLYGILSFNIPWPWPQELRESLPPWINGWLALMGLLIGGGVAVAGYLVGDQWSKVIRFSAYKSMAAQAERLNDALREFKGSIPELRQSADISENPAESEGAESIEQQTVAMLAALKQVQTADISEMAACSPGDANMRRAFALALIALAALLIGGNIILQSGFLARTQLGAIADWAPYAFAAIMAAAMMLFGWLAATILQATRIGRGGDAKSQRFQVRDHGLGLPQIFGIIGALVMIAFGVSLATNGFSRLEFDLLLASVGLNIATFGLGAMSESIASALIFLVRMVWHMVLALVLAVAALLTGAVWLVLRALEVITGVIAAPALWLISLMRRGGQSTPRSGPTLATSTDQPRKGAA